jgi:hypothetical protein
LAQNVLYVTNFSERRCGTSAEMKFVKESRFQPTLKGAAKKLSRVVGKLDRIADTLFVSLLAAELFVTREMRLHSQCRP